MVWACPLQSLGSRFPLQLRALITGLAWFPLQSLTRNAQPTSTDGLDTLQPSISRTESNRLYNAPNACELMRNWLRSFGLDSFVLAFSIFKAGS